MFLYPIVKFQSHFKMSQDGVVRKRHKEGKTSKKSPNDVSDVLATKNDKVRDIIAADKNDVDKILRQKIKEKLSPAHSRLGVMFFKKVLPS